MVLPAFAQLLSALPNLHTIEFVHVHSQMAYAIQTAVEGRTFPSVRTLVLPTCAHDMLPHCPAVESVTCNEDTGGLITSAIKIGHGSNIRELLGIKLTPITLKRTSFKV